jgi:hypothetical protein
VAALTDVEYDLTVTETETGSVWKHQNVSGRLESVADIKAFPPYLPIPVPSRRGLRW